MKKQHILVVTRNLPPMVGGMERLLWHVIDALRQEYCVVVVGPKGCRAHLPEDVQTAEVFSRSLPVFFLLATLTTFWLALRRRPSLVFAGSGLTAPLAWMAARLRRAVCLVYLHGLDIRVAHSVYQKCWIPFLRHFDRVVVNSEFTRQLAIEAGVLPKRLCIIHPGVELPAVENAHERGRLFRVQHGVGQRPILLSVGRMTPRKGLSYFLEHIFPEILLQRPDAMLVVIGGAPVHALHGGFDEPIKINHLIIQLQIEQNILILGQCPDAVLDDAYFAADVLIFPVQTSGSDIEGFGMVALEAAAHGLPTVAFSVGGVVDAVADGLSGILISPGENGRFAQAVLDTIKSLDSDMAASNCKKFAQAFSWPIFTKKILQIVKSDH